MTSSSSTTDGSAPPTASADRSAGSERVEVGRIVRPHGVRGELLVQSLTDVPGRFARGARLELVQADGARRTVTVRSSAWPMPDRLMVTFEGIADRDAAELVRGARLEVERAAVPEAPAGEFWQFDLVGCRAFDERAGELGDVVDVTDAGAGPLLVVALADGRKVPLPFVERFVVAVDPAGRRIDWRLPEGLIDACASRF